MQCQPVNHALHAVPAHAAPAPCTPTSTMPTSITHGQPCGVNNSLDRRMGPDHWWGSALCVSFSDLMLSVGTSGQQKHVPLITKDSLVEYMEEEKMTTV